jgi:hypothetical protein
MRRLLLAGLCIATQVVAQSPSQNAAPTPAPADSEAIGLAHHMLVALRAEQSFTQGVESAIKMQRAQRSQLPPVFFDSLLTALKRAAPQVVDSLAPVYAASLTKQDLRDLTKFFESPVGQRYADAQGTITTATSLVGQRLGARVALDVMKTLIDAGQMPDIPPD